ncbi:hypothetical protein [Paenibacillus paeoniae]|uniref:DUF3221 domain-containing protein n=1 Tax=Paenibacillus paeoniae TaxID=2292705 RepID=A0A371PGQ6_9BACL|nr:hypothetical protein [Paenibacillus paeoniae]REK75024.1 hypothetical protein DX130_15415 [Paenibacillus paeoniae]
MKINKLIIVPVLVGLLAGCSSASNYQDPGNHTKFQTDETSATFVQLHEENEILLTWEYSIQNVGIEKTNPMYPTIRIYDEDVSSVLGFKQYPEHGIQANLIVLELDNVQKDGQLISIQMVEEQSIDMLTDLIVNKKGLD